MSLNYILNLSYAAAVFHYMGPQAFTFLILSSIFSIGFHPVGARWISEHFCVCPTQETYSYYGPINKVSFNIGCVASVCLCSWYTGLSVIHLSLCLSVHRYASLRL